MLMILLSPLSVIRLLMGGKASKLDSDVQDSEIGKVLLIFMLVQLSFDCLKTLVSLIWKWLGLSLMNNHLWRCWYFFSPLIFSGPLILIVSTAKITSTKIDILIHSMKFISSEECCTFPLSFTQLLPIHHPYLYEKILLMFSILDASDILITQISSTWYFIVVIWCLSLILDARCLILNLDDSSISLPGCLSRTNLKLGNIFECLKVVKNVITDFDSLKSSLDCIPVVTLKSCEEPWYILAEIFYYMFYGILFLILMESLICATSV